MGKMIVSCHKTRDNRKILTICDNNLVGKKFEEGKFQLDLTSDFFKGAEKSKEAIKKDINDAFTVILIGRESVDLGYELNIILKKDVMTIQQTPYAQCIFV